MKQLISLGIECTAHTFGVALIKGKKPLVNIKHSYTTEKGGIIPIQAAQHHNEVKDRLLQEALEKTGIKLEEIDLIAVLPSSKTLVIAPRVSTNSGV